MFHLQRGEDDRAREVLTETLGKENYQRSFISAFHLAAMPARYAAERRQWEEAQTWSRGLRSICRGMDRLILAGWIARAEGRPDEAVELIREAAELEGTVEKHPVTPGALMPPFEALGDLLLDLDRPAYDASDEVWPRAPEYTARRRSCSRSSR